MQVWTSGKFHLQYNIKNRLTRKTTIKEEKELCTKHTAIRIKDGINLIGWDNIKMSTWKRWQSSAVCVIWFTRDPERLQTNNIE